MEFVRSLPDQMGIYTGSTLHEVAHVVGARARKKQVLVPVLLITTYMQKFQKIAIPWFAIGFMGVIAPP